ncbi:MAG: hypothetical protein ABI624_17845 [Casimicrobiaceae bacterium]
MADPPMTIDRARTALLELVSADRERKCAAILDDASVRAKALFKEAHATARARVRATFAEERERMAARIAAAEAMLATRRRLAEQRRAAALVAAGWERLPGVLERAWRDPAARAAWVGRIVTEAQALLPAGAWRIVHSPDWPAGEREAFAAQLSATHAGSEQVADPLARAGLKIVAAGNVIDGTLAGLTQDRAEIGALLLRELESTEQVK